MLIDFIGKLWLFLARLIHWRRRRARFIVLIGGPGAGKGTLASRLAPTLKLPHLSMGDVFRREIAAGTAVGKQVESCVKSGALAPDELTIAALASELAQPKYHGGAVLDGFPRRLKQAVLLDRLLARWGNRVERVIFLLVPKDDLIERLSNRRTCSNKLCGRSYHLLRQPPAQADKCDACGQALYQREDDVPEAIEERLAVFAQQSRPLCHYYLAQGLLTSVQSTNAKGPEAVFTEVLSAISAPASGPNALHSPLPM